MSPLAALILGMVEGLTEFLPVSSTGHLILVGEWLHADGPGTKSFTIVIQLGALGAVAVYYRRLLSEHLGGLWRREAASLRLAGALCTGFLPVAVVGLLLGHTIKSRLFGVRPVAIGLLVGGVVMVAVERLCRRRPPESSLSLEAVNWRTGLWIGLGQCFSLWPGTSRAMCTMVSGQLVGLSTATAAEFSFLLALPTLGMATLYELYQSRRLLLVDGERLPLFIGLAVSFWVAWAVIAAFLRYLKRYGLEPFGYYRMVVGLIVLMSL